MACRVMIPKKISTMVSHDPEVGVKWMVLLGLRTLPVATSRAANQVEPDDVADLRLVLQP